MTLRAIRLFFLLLGYLILCGCSHEEQRRVLVIHSYEDIYAGYPEFNRLIREQFKKEKIAVDIRTLYLDCETYSEAEELIQMNHLLDSISKGWTPEVILVNEDQATYSLLKAGHQLSRTTPIVFGGVNYPNQGVLRQHSNVTGFHDCIDIMANINMAKELFGEQNGLFTILDRTYLDNQIRADLAKQTEGHKIIGIDSSDLRTSKMKIGERDRERWRMVREEGYTRFLVVGGRGGGGDGSLMWALRKFYAQQCYIQLKRDFTTVNIGNICVYPSLTVINEGFGFGEKLLGGYFTTLPIQVEEEVGVAARILRGEKPSDIPITDSRKEYTVDWKVMDQLDIPVSRIPAKYNIINIPLREKYPVSWAIGICLFSLSVTTLIIWLFLLYRREQRRKKKALYALADEKQALSLAIRGSRTYAWRFENNRFIFEHALWSSQKVESRELSLAELLQFIHPEERIFALENWDANKVRTQIHQMRCDFNGRGYQWWEFRYETQLLETGNTKTAGLMLNIQEVKDREQELEHARMLAEKAELKQSFLANMSHEIRTPLNAIVGFSNILISEEDIEPDEKQVYIETINRNNELLLKLINDILEISRIESGSMSFTFEDCRVAELVDNIYMTHQVLIPKQLEFIKETDPTPMTIRVDVGRLTQVITNFLNNASKFTESGYIKLGYRYLPEQEQVCIYVEDSGKGIPAEEQKMIFSRFYKQDEFSQGTGLGLSICQVIIEKLDGRIDLWSELGQGSRFMVFIPCKIEQ